MGGSKSKEQPDPQPLLSEPWRTLDWSKRDEMKETVRRFQISAPDVKRLRILVHGPVGAGKSSFINSIDNVFQERMTSRAIAEAGAGHRCTKMYRSHKIKDGGYESHLKFVLCDVMGLEREDSAGVQTEDLMNILEGHIKDDYVFNPTSACSEKEKGYNKDPDLKDKIHCLVSVIPANSLLWHADEWKAPDNVTDDEFINKFRIVRERANMLGIPQVVILSKVDEACPNVNADIKMIYRSIRIQKQINFCSFNVGVPLNCIFPVKNYHEEIHLNYDMDVLLLSALTNILNFGNDFVGVMAERKKKEIPITDRPAKSSNSFV